MKRNLVLLLGLCAFAGCARYDMALTNGIRITNVSKPKFDQRAEVYVYKDITGKERFIPAGRVVEIMPHSRANENRLAKD